MTRTTNVKTTKVEKKIKTVTTTKRVKALSELPLKPSDTAVKKIEKCGGIRQFIFEGLEPWNEDRTWMQLTALCRQILSRILKAFFRSSSKTFIERISAPPGVLKAEEKLHGYTVAHNGIVGENPDDVYIPPGTKSSIVISSYIFKRCDTESKLNSLVCAIMRETLHAFLNYTGIIQGHADPPPSFYGALVRFNDEGELQFTYNELVGPC